MKRNVEALEAGQQTDIIEANLIYIILNNRRSYEELSSVPKPFI